MEEKTSVKINPAIGQGLAALLRAHEYAEDVGCDPWDFALEVSALYELGITSSDLRWLCCKGYLDHAREVGMPGDQQRRFDPSGHLSITQQHCYKLSPKGVRFAQSCHDEPAVEPPASGHIASPPTDLVPYWDGERHQLRYRTQIVKSFKLPSPNQETILATFQEENWPARITDPLPPVAEIDPKRRLQDTIKSLNRCQKIDLIRFSGDGTGEGVLWQFRDNVSPGNN